MPSFAYLCKHFHLQWHYPNAHFSAICCILYDLTCCVCSKQNYLVTFTGIFLFLKIIYETRKQNCQIRSRDCHFHEVWNSERQVCGCMCDSLVSISCIVCVKTVDCRGSALLPYMAMLQRVLDRTLHLACREGYLSSSCILRHILSSLTSITPVEYRSVPGSFDRPIKDYLPIKVCIFIPFT